MGIVSITGRTFLLGRALDTISKVVCMISFSFHPFTCRSSTFPKSSRSYSESDSCNYSVRHSTPRTVCVTRNIFPHFRRLSCFGNGAVEVSDFFPSLLHSYFTVCCTKIIMNSVRAVRLSLSDGSSELVVWVCRISVKTIALACSPPSQLLHNFYHSIEFRKVGHEACVFFGQGHSFRM